MIKFNLENLNYPYNKRYIIEKKINNIEISLVD